MEAGRNLLAGETSPYLLQHAHNPVHWRPWGSAALAEAKRRDYPILLSIGYAACHWCHVMAHESFENAETARLMNELFVNIKVDREERPDIDHIYMTALQALGQQGGWPLTMFLTPHGQPMLGGTYWPPEPRWGRPSFRQVLESVDAAWRARREEMERRGLTLTDHLATLSTLNPGPGVTPEDLTRIGDALLSAVDPVHGGLRGAPKFPNAPIFRFFWNEMFRRREAAFGEALRAMLEAMNAGGIYDHLGGGYARYSTDAEWLVPHFEKMLYDNAQILELLALVHSLRPDPTFDERARETVGWLMREMRVGDAFAASLDADQDGEEGLFYVWREDEIDAALGDAAARFKAAYDVTRGGNWEGRTVLRRVSPRGSSDEEAELAASRAKLFAVREARPKPSRDDKVLADWNGLTIAALVRASAVFGEPAWIATARAAFDFVMGKLRGGDGRLLHAWREGHPGARALIDDYASMARAALALFEAGGEPRDLDAARSLAAEALDLFGDGAGGVYLTASDAADVPGARPRQAHDGASPSGVGLLAEVFVRLWHLTDEPRWREAAQNLIRAVSGAPEGLGGSPLTLMSADMLERGGSVVVDGPLDDPRAQALAEAALGAPDPSLTVLRLDRSLWPGGLPRADLPRTPAPAAMLCQGQTCSLPVTTPEALKALMEARRETPPG
ncbi:MAG: thioredoxin domain-containing protein [Roseiarcus sp.]|uniref:thioredoxin domain-containing protein n=1 Tax=Roseiarcus sp. TaxID=1969460 RepID=UPI003C4FE7DD